MKQQVQNVPFLPDLNKPQDMGGLLVGFKTI